MAKSDGLSDLVTFLSFTVVFVVLFNLVDVVFTKDTIDYVDGLTIAHHARTLLSGLLGYARVELGAWFDPLCE